MKYSFVIVFLFLLLALVFFFVSLYSFVFDVEYNRCEMTYMWQYPEYIRITLPPSVKRKFPQYNLFVYTEGHSEPVSRGVFEGLPLLFIPGNDGSHKQVRSLASVAIQMRKSLGSKTRFDCFAVDLNSEFSALHGPFLYRQSEFVRHVVDHIESLYTSRAKFSIVLVGHSMGGLVARHAMTLDEFDRGRVPLIVTLAAPHQRPVVNTDNQMSNFYADMNGYWHRQKATALGHVTLVSVGGGDRDLEVALPLTRIEQGLTLPRNALWASASHVKNAWASTDHRCIVWCKQLVIALCRALFAASGSLDSAKSIATEFRRHLLPLSPSLILPTLPTSPPGSSEASRWFYRDLSDPRQRAFRFERDRLTRPIFLKIVGPPGGRLLSPGESAVFLLDGSVAVGDSGWLFACLDGANDVANSSLNAPCRTLLRLDSAYGRELPPSGLHRRLARIDADGGDSEVWLQKAVAFALVLGPSEDQTELLFDLRASASRNLHLHWNPWPLAATLAASSASQEKRTEETGIHLPSGSLYSSVDLSVSSGHSQTWFGYEATLEATNCRALAGTPGCLAQEDQTDIENGGVGYAHSVQYFNQNASLTLVDCSGSGTCRLHAITNPLCDYRLSVQFRPQAFGAALLRLAGVEVPTWAGLHIISTMLSSMAAPSSRSLHGTLLANPGLPMLTAAVACLPVIAGRSTSISTGDMLSRLIRQISLACLAAPLAVAILLSMAIIVALLGFLLRAPKSLLLRGSLQQSNGERVLFARNFANFLSPIGCILALYMTQCHCAAAGIAFLLITQLLKTAAIRIDLPTSNASLDTTASERLLSHSSILTAVCSLLTCLCGPSLFVWAKALQSGQSQLPVSDPHYSLGVAFALLYAVDSALVANASWRFSAPPLVLGWPTAACLSILIGAIGAQLHGNYAGLARLLVLLLGALTLTRCAIRAGGYGDRVKKD